MNAQPMLNATSLYLKTTSNRTAQVCAVRKKSDSRRYLLSSYEGQEIELQGMFVKNSTRWFNPLGATGRRRGVKVETYLFCNVTRNGRCVAEHVWVDSAPVLRGLNLQPGTVLRFRATVMSYRKNGGTTTGVIDYGVTNLQNIEVIKA